MNSYLQQKLKKEEDAKKKIAEQESLNKKYEAILANLQKNYDSNKPVKENLKYIFAETSYDINDVKLIDNYILMILRILSVLKTDDIPNLCKELEFNDQKSLLKYLVTIFQRIPENPVEMKTCRSDVLLKIYSALISTSGPCLLNSVLSEKGFFRYKLETKL